MLSDALMQMLLAMLGQLFLLVLFAALIHQRKRIGGAALAMSFAVALFCGCISMVAGLVIPVPGGGEADFTVVVIKLPVLTAFLLLYICGGVLASQRLLIGTMCSYLLFIYFAMMIKLQCSFLDVNMSRSLIYALLENVRESINYNAVRTLLALLTAPMFYSMCRKLPWRFVRVLLTLTAAQCVAFLPEVIIGQIDNSSAGVSAGTVKVLAVLTVFSSAFVALYVRISGRSVDDRKSGTFDLIFAFFGSYSRMRELEADVSNLENRYRLVLQNTAEAVIMCDSDGTINEANISAGRVFGVKPAELIGRKLFSLFVPENDFDAADTLEQSCYFTCRVNESVTMLSVSLTPVRMGAHLLLVMVARDITRERQLAEEKMALTEQLMHSQRMESLGVLAGGIAHDFNNYTHAILGHADVALMMCGNDPEKVNSHLRKIAEIAERSGKLTSQLLGFARKGKYHVVDVDLTQLLDECITLLDPEKMFNITVKRDYSRRVTVRGDQLQLQQVMMNLLINAVDAIASGAGEKVLHLTAGSALSAPLKFTPPPDDPDASAEKFVCFSITDNGCGMDEETRRKIFEPFFTTKPIGQGTGMGLAMVYGTVSHHKGHICVESTPGKGTTFCVFLPAASAGK